MKETINLSNTESPSVDTRGRSKESVSTKSINPDNVKKVIDFLVKLLIAISTTFTAINV